MAPFFLLCLYLGVAFGAWPVAAIETGAVVDPVGEAVEIYSLSGDWLFQPGDNPAWASPGLDDSDWQTMATPGRWPAGGFPETGQMAWYRLTLQLDPGHSQINSLGVKLGKVLSAYELYAGGELLGGVGKLPPLGEVDYGRQAVFTIPVSAVAVDGRLVLAMRVWGGSDRGVAAFGGGAFAGEFALGDFGGLLSRSYLAELPSLLISMLFAGFGLYHLYLFHRNRQLQALLWFGLMALVIAVYALMDNQWKYTVDLSFLTYQKIKFGAIYLFPALGIQVLWSLLDKPIGPLLRAYQLSFPGWALVVVIVPGIDIHYLSLKTWQLWSVPLLGIVSMVIVRSAREGHPEARTMLLGTAVFVATCINDMLIDLLRVETRRLVPYGFVAVMLAMAVSLANRFTTMFTRLEEEVDQRTADLQRANLQLEEAAHRDPLTGVLNRRGLVAEAEMEIRRSLRSRRPLAIVLADIDRFKSFNDSYGHACGDHVLKKVAGLLGRQVREMDHLGRWGGEEFILVLPETDDQGASILAEKLRTCVEGSIMDYGGDSVSVTMTFGLAEYRRGETLDACIARADTALNTGKERGRNRVMIGNYKGLTLVN